ncbi:hypothetical protein KR026_008722 [Drosophila bipectinata]|nr:hypothetical protein KR026_008722 [Drosophila bipectinata]
MANNSNVKKIVQVSEEAAPVVQIPVMVGNELFVLTQQDIRRVEDTRVFSYNRVVNGQLWPMETPVPVNDAFSHGVIQSSLPLTNHSCTLHDLLPPKHATFNLNNSEGNNLATSMYQVSCRPPKTVASMATQLGWSKHTEEPRPSFKLKLNAATSTGGLMTSIGCQNCSMDKKHDTSCQTQTTETRNQTSDSTRNSAKAPKKPCSQTQAKTACKACNTTSSHVVWKSSSTEHSSEEGDSMSEGDDEPSRRCGCRRCKSIQAIPERRGKIHRRCPVDDPCPFQSTNADRCSRDEQGFYSRGIMKANTNPRSQSHSPASEPRPFPYELNRYYQELQDERRRSMRKSEDDCNMTDSC